MKQQQASVKNQKIQKKASQPPVRSKVSNRVSAHPSLQAQGIIGNHGVLRYYPKEVAVKLYFSRREDHKPLQAEARKMQQSAREFFSLERVKGLGSPIPYKVEMERFFDRDFSYVRAHTDVDAQSASNVLGAGALTFGDNIFFANDHPTKATVAHELTHIVQHNLAHSNESLAFTSRHDQAELEAKAVQQAIVKGSQPFEISSILPPSVVAADWGPRNTVQINNRNIEVEYNPELQKLRMFVPGPPVDLGWALFGLGAPPISVENVEEALGLVDPHNPDIYTNILQIESWRQGETEDEFWGWIIIFDVVIEDEYQQQLLASSLLCQSALPASTPRDLQIAIPGSGAATTHTVYEISHVAEGVSQFYEPTSMATATRGLRTGLLSILSACLFIYNSFVQLEEAMSAGEKWAAIRGASYTIVSIATGLQPPNPPSNWPDSNQEAFTSTRESIRNQLANRTQEQRNQAIAPFLSIGSQDPEVLLNELHQLLVEEHMDNMSLHLARNYWLSWPRPGGGRYIHEGVQQELAVSRLE